MYSPKMPKRKAKECVKLTEEDDKRIRREEKKEDLVDEEVERQIAAIRAIRDVEIEQTITALRLLRSYFTEEQLDTPVLDFFKENLPDLSISRNEETGEIELKWKDENVKASLLGTDNPQLENLVFQGTSDNHMLASHAAFQTPGVNGQRLSFGMTPKTRRLPKPGEMMLSVHGSPLGVYKEDHNIGAINEENS